MEFLGNRKLGFTQVNKGQVFLITFLILFTIFFQSQPKVEAVQSKLSKVYHVYVDEDYIGKINDLSIIDHALSKKISEVDREDLSLFIAEDITYIPEQSFNPRYNNEQVRKILQNLLTVKLKAYALKIDGETIGYFETEEMIDRLLQTYKENFVDKKDLEQLKQKENSLIFANETLYLENKKQFMAERKALKPGQRELVDVFLDHEIEVFKEEAEPEFLLTEEEALHILNKAKVEEENHKIKEGEVLQTISRKYDLTIDEVLKLNPSLQEDSLLQIGQEIRVIEYKPSYDVVVIEEEAAKEKIPFETEVIESDDLYKGEEEIKQKGKEGEKEVLYEVEKKNGLELSRKVVKEKLIKKPKKKIIIKGTKVIPSRGSGKYIWPTNGGYISSHYGYRWGRLHKGIDIARPSNRTIKAADHGVVSFTGYKGGYGNKIVINHNNGMKTLYAHLSSINVRPGQVVEKGTAIGIMGSTGNSTGVHLHFEIHQNGVPKNPMQFY